MKFRPLKVREAGAIVLKKTTEVGCYVRELSLLKKKAVVSGKMDFRWLKETI